MAPSKKGKGGNKKSDASPKKDIATKKRKRKLSDMLGTQWSKVELQHFYEAYRKYGQDWKKVAAIVRNRSGEMVEAVYILNKAYLSLPEGTASVAGLIAMMTDHYSVLEGSDSGHDTDDASDSSRKLQKRVRGKVGRGNPEGLDSHLPVSSNSQPVGLSRGFLSLLDERSSGGTRPHAVGKRTPRVPVSYIYDKNYAQKYFSSSRHGFKYKTNPNDDDVAHEIALALTEASQRGGSSHDSQTPKRKKENVMSSPSQNVLRRPIQTTESELALSKLSGNEIDEEGFEGSLGSTEADIGLSMRDRKYLMETEGVSTLEVPKKGGFFGKNLEMGFGNHSLDDIKEACSGTEQEQSLGSVERKHEYEVAFTKNARSSFKGPKKTSKKVLFGAAQGSEFEALQALADLSLMLPSDNDAGVCQNVNDQDQATIQGALRGYNERVKKILSYALPERKFERLLELICTLPASTAVRESTEGMSGYTPIGAGIDFSAIGASKMKLKHSDRRVVTDTSGGSSSRGRQTSPRSPARHYVGSEDSFSSGVLLHRSSKARVTNLGATSDQIPATADQIPATAGAASISPPSDNTELMVVSPISFLPLQESESEPPFIIERKSKLNAIQKEHGVEHLQHRATEEKSKASTWVPQFGKYADNVLSTESTLFHDENDALDFIKGMGTPRDARYLDRKDELSKHRLAQHHLLKALMLISQNDHFVESSSQKILELSNIVNQMTAQIKSLTTQRDELKDAASKVVQLRSLREANELVVRDLGEKAKMALKRWESTKAQLAKAQEDNAGLEQSLASKNRRVENLAQVLAELQAQSDVVEAKCADLQAKLDGAAKFYQAEVDKEASKYYLKGLDDGYQKCLDAYELVESSSGDEVAEPVANDVVHVAEPSSEVAAEEAEDITPIGQIFEQLKVEVGFPVRGSGLLEPVVILDDPVDEQSVLSTAEPILATPLIAQPSEKLPSNQLTDPEDQLS